LVIKKENVSLEDLKKYNNTKIIFSYFSEWYLNNTQKLDKYYYNPSSSSTNVTFPYLIELYPEEFKYMKTPIFCIEINKLSSYNTDISEYYKNLYQLLQADENTFPKFINYTKINLNENLVYKTFINTTLIAEAGGGNDIGNSINLFFSYLDYKKWIFV
jgi:hypothetical protein